MWALDVDTADDQIDAKVSSVSEGLRRKSASGHLDSALRVSIVPVHFELPLNPLGNMVAISGGTSTAAVDIWGQVMDLEAVLVSNSGSSGRPGISSDSNTVLKNKWLTSDLL